MAKSKSVVPSVPLPTRPDPDPQCDCLNTCGDDPWVIQGRAKPCDTYTRWRAEKKARADSEEMAGRIRMVLAKNPEQQEFTVTRTDLEVLLGKL